MYPDFDCGNPWEDAEDKALFAYELYEEGQLNQALDQLDLAIQMNPENSAWHFNRGLTLDAMDKYSEAIEEYRIALELSGEDLEIMNCLAVDFTRTAQYDMALSTFEQIQSLDSNFEPAYCNRIITYTEMELHAKAEEMFYLAQQIKPDCAICFYNIGNSLYSRGEFERALWCWEKTQIIDPSHPQIDLRIAQTHWAMKNSQLANIHFLEEIRNDPGNVEVIIDYGRFLLEDNKIDSAREKFNRILELCPDHAESIFYLGEIAYSQNDLKEAATQYLRAISKDSYMTGPRFRLAQISRTTGANQDALKYLKEELDLDIEDAEVLLAMGAVFMKLDEFDLAAHCFLRVTDMEPQNPKGYHYLGMAIATQNEVEDAIKFLEHTVEIDEYNTELHTDLARLYALNGEYENAKSQIEKATLLSPKDPDLIKLMRRVSTQQMLDKLKNGMFKCKNFFSFKK